MTDRWLQPINAAMSTMGFDNGGTYSLGGDPTQGLGGVTGRTGRQGDPTLQGWSPTMNLGTDLLMDQALPAWDAAMQASHPDQSSSLSAPGWGAYAGMPGGAVSTAGGQWATLDALNGAFSQMQSQLGVPANLIKGIIAREGSYGNDWYTVPRRGENILAFNGVFQSTATSHGIDWNRMITDKNYAVWATGKVMRDIYDSQGGQYGWAGAAATYLTGSPTGTSDPEGVTNTNDYLYGPNGVITHWKTLDGYGGSNPSQDPGGGWNSGTGGGSSSLASMFGPTASVPGWGEFNVPSSNGLYGYGTAYGMNGTNHTGVDVPMNFGSPMRAPTGGTVLCAGTGVGTDEAGGGCAAFQSTMGGGQGQGRIELRLDNGAVLIFGHSSGAAVRPGQRVNAGDLIGYSGGMNSPHVHLEARVVNANGNWQIVDPRSVLGGGSWPSGGTYSAAGPSNAGYGSSMWSTSPANFWQSVATGSWPGGGG